MAAVYNRCVMRIENWVSHQSPTADAEWKPNRLKVIAANEMLFNPGGTLCYYRMRFPTDKTIQYSALIAVFVLLFVFGKAPTLSIEYALKIAAVTLGVWLALYVAFHSLYWFKREKNWILHLSASGIYVNTRWLVDRVTTDGEPVAIQFDVNEIVTVKRVVGKVAFSPSGRMARLSSTVVSARIELKSELSTALGAVLTDPTGEPSLARSMLGPGYREGDALVLYWQSPMVDFSPKIGTVLEALQEAGVRVLDEDVA